MLIHHSLRRAVVAVATAAWLAAAASPEAQTPPPTSQVAKPPAAQTPGSAPAAPTAADPITGLTPPPDYVIGPDDILVVMYWRDDKLSAEVAVRPDGMISLPLINEIKAAGLTPEELRRNVIKAATKYVEDPTVSVVVKQINSRKVFITGMVNKPGPYPLSTHMTVLQLISLAGGLQEYADKEHIIIVSGTEKRPDGAAWSYPFNYADVMKRRNLKQNRELMPGDTVIVP